MSDRPEALGDEGFYPNGQRVDDALEAGCRPTWIWEMGDSEPYFHGTYIWNMGEGPIMPEKGLVGIAPIDEDGMSQWKSFLSNLETDRRAFDCEAMVSLELADWLASTIQRLNRENRRLRNDMRVIAADSSDPKAALIAEEALESCEPIEESDG